MKLFLEIVAVIFLPVEIVYSWIEHFTLKIFSRKNKKYLR